MFVRVVVVVLAVIATQLLAKRQAVAVRQKACCLLRLTRPTP